MDRLFVAYKPPFISSNRFLQHLKRKYEVKKAGFSGTLDPFASGVLIIAFGKYTRLFKFLNKQPKVYKAVLWLGARSSTLDIEGIREVKEIKKLPLEKVKEVVESFKGEFSYTPPSFSAKKVKGVRAYELAKKGEKLNLPKVNSYIHSIKLLNYTHPFITFEAKVSEGTYIRSLGEEIAKKLGNVGSLSYLERVQEGVFTFGNERALNPLEYLISKPNTSTLSPKEIKEGKKIPLSSLKFQTPGLYHLEYEDFFTIIEVEEDEVKYKVNLLPKVSN